MSKPTAAQRLTSAISDIDYYTRQINYHDAEASRLRKIREKHKAKRQRAEDAINREVAAAAYERDV